MFQRHGTSLIEVTGEVHACYDFGSSPEDNYWNAEPFPLNMQSLFPSAMDELIASLEQ
jgi:hypothetical protein